MLGKHRWHPDSLTRVVSLYGWPPVWMNSIRPNISQAAESKQMRSLLTPEIRGSNPYISNFYSQSTVLKRLKYRKRGREWAKKETNEDPKSILPERWQQYIGWRLLRQNVKIFSKSLLLPAKPHISFQALLMGWETSIFVLDWVCMCVYLRALSGKMEVGTTLGTWYGITSAKGWSFF